MKISGVLQKIIYSPISLKYGQFVTRLKLVSVQKNLWLLTYLEWWKRKGLTIGMCKVRYTNDRWIPSPLPSGVRRDTCVMKLHWIVPVKRHTFHEMRWYKYQHGHQHQNAQIVTQSIVSQTSTAQWTAYSLSVGGLLDEPPKTIYFLPLYT